MVLKINSKIKPIERRLDDLLLKKVVNYFKGWQEKKILTIFLTTGSVIALAGVPKWYNSMFDAVLKTNLAASHDEIHYPLVVIGAVLMFVGFWFYIIIKRTEKKLNMIQIRHLSIESVGFSKIASEMNNYNVEVVTLNQLEELKEVNKDNLKHALWEQEKLVQNILNRLHGSSDLEVSYFGLAHIPLMILLGYQIADKSSVKFFEWNQNKFLWDEIQSNSKAFPALVEEENLQQSVEETKEVIIKVGLTYPIQDSDLLGLDLDGLNSFYFHLEQPHRNAIISVEQLEKYKQQFRGLLDKINQMYPQLQRVHLFYSGQPSFAYRLGSAITERMDKEIIVYNYVGTSNPKYNWAINLKKPGKPITVFLTGDRGEDNV